MTAPDVCRTWPTKSGTTFRPGDVAWCSTHQQWHDVCLGVTPRPSLLRRVFAALHSGGAASDDVPAPPPATT